jgi:5-deoxy-D-glucuronate isomerase
MAVSTVANRILASHYVRPAEVNEGYSPILTPQDAPLRDLCVGRLRLDIKSGRYAADTSNRETLLHILVGQCTIEAEAPTSKRKFENLGERRDVFSGLPTAVVLGPGTHYSVQPVSRTVDIAIVSVPLPNPQTTITPTVVRPQDVQVHQVGELHYARTVREVIGGEGPALRLRAGETINPIGLWSSWPHHNFDADPHLAPRFEEVFLYFTKPKTGWGIQRREGLYCNLEQVDDVLVVRNGDAAVLPLGNHPVVAGVDGSRLYLWFYVSPIPKVYSRWAEDLGGYA